MRTGTILVLLGLIVMFAYFGWQVFSFIAFLFLGTILLGILIVAAGIWTIKRRMRARVEELTKAWDRAGGRDPGAPPDAIDVEGKVRDTGPRRPS